jgi:hypothetical protein
LADVADLAGDAGDVDDASAAAVEHVDDGGFAHVEGAGEVDAQDFVPVVDAHFPDGPVDGDAGVVDEDVEAAVLLDDLLDDALAVVGVADVALMQVRVPPSASIGLAQLVGACWLEEKPAPTTRPARRGCGRSRRRSRGCRR